MAWILSVGPATVRGRPPEKNLLRPFFGYGPFIVAPSGQLPAARIPSGPQGLREKCLDFRPVLAQQPLQVQHARPRLALVPRRVEPPTVPGLLLQPELQQPQQQHRQQLHLRSADDRALGPGPTFLPPQPLFQIPEPVLLAEAGARSEERRVGKECRPRWSLYREEKSDNRE